MTPTVGVNLGDAEAPLTRAARAGFVYGLAAYIWWGLVPIYFKAVGHVPPLEVLAHRIIWSVVLLVVWLAIRGRLRAVQPASAL